MYNQEEYIFSEFIKNFAKLKEQPIVLYGISERTGNLLRKISDYHVIGLMDGKRKSGEIWNKPILSEREVAEAGVHTIIIIARPAVIRMIYHRIEIFAYENNIQVYDIYGNDLFVKYHNQEYDIPYYHTNWEALYLACTGYDIITFDIFDTLLVRKTLFPKDIFKIVERKMGNCEERIENFSKVRMEAEERCYKRGLNPTIDQIYEELSRLTGAKKKIIQEYLNAELNTEFIFIAPRKSMRDFFDKVREKKPIYLISDMYLPSGFIHRILRKCGYEGYKDIFVSCEYGCSKRDGLFYRFLEQFSEKRSILHIGDDEVADDMCARDAGIDSFHIMNGRELLENSVYNILLEQKSTLLKNLMTGLFCYKAFDDPFVFYERKGKLKINDHKALAYLFCAPVFMCFCVWMMRKICEMECEYVLYPSRDAYILKKICKIILDLQHVNDFPDGKYLYTSRRALNAATVFSESDIRRIAEYQHFGSMKEMIWERFRVNINEGFTEKKELLLVIDQYETEILESCRKERENYLNYLNKEVGKSYQKLACMDFIAVGSVQNGLCKLMPEKSIIGFYFQKKVTEDKALEQDMQSCSFYEPHGEYEIDTNIYQFYLFLELVLTSPEPTFYSVKSDNTPMFMKETRKQEQIALVMDMQDAVLEYVRDVSELYPDLLGEKITPEFPDRILGFLGKEYSEVVNEKILNMVLVDEYMSKEFNIFDRL